MQGHLASWWQKIMASGLITSWEIDGETVERVTDFFGGWGSKITAKEMRVQSLNQEHPLEEGMATHSSVLAWGIPWTEEPGEI